MHTRDIRIDALVCTTTQPRAQSMRAPASCPVGSSTTLAPPLSTEQRHDGPPDIATTILLPFVSVTLTSIDFGPGSTHTTQ
jgi:hypothetical protein